VELTNDTIANCAKPSTLLKIVLTDVDIYPSTEFEINIFNNLVNCLRAIFKPLAGVRELAVNSRAVTSQADTISIYYIKYLYQFLQAIDMIVPDGWGADDVVAKHDKLARANKFLDTVQDTVEVCLQQLNIRVIRK
jgi:hypothetical protein